MAVSRQGCQPQASIQQLKSLVGAARRRGLEQLLEEEVAHSVQHECKLQARASDSPSAGTVVPSRILRAKGVPDSSVWTKF